MEEENSGMTFWDHLEVLRGVLFKALAIAVIAAIAAFCFKDLLFSIILGPSTPDFILYQGLASLAQKMGLDPSGFTDFHVDLFSATLSAQFMTHMKVAFYMGLIVSMPYILYLLYGFVAPALRKEEKKYTTAVVGWAYILFMAGVLLNYFLIFPLAFRFLGTYQVSADVPNIITLVSYIDMLMTMTLLMGIMFELPVLSWFMARLGVINSSFMKKYRKHAFVVILAIGAVITPTTDVFTLIIVALPIYLLYECSIRLVSRIDRQRERKLQADA